TFGGGGMIGDGTSGTNRTVPTAVLGGITFSSLLGGGLVHSCAVANTGQPFCWGSGSQLGDGSGATALTPVPVPWVQGTAGAARARSSWRAATTEAVRPAQRLARVPQCSCATTQAILWRTRRSRSR